MITRVEYQIDENSTARWQQQVHHNKTKLAGMVVTATQRLKKLEVDLNTFQIGQNDTFSTQNYKIDIQEHKTNMVYEINGANNLYFKSNI